MGSPVSWIRRWSAALLFGVAVGCAPKVTPPDTFADGAPEPVYFKYGKAELASKDDTARVEAAAALLKGDDKQYLFLAGYADPTGKPGANMALSQARAEVVREAVLAASGVDEKRVIAKGLGELDRNNRGNTSLRRVDFIWVQRGLVPPKDSSRVVATLVEAGVIDPGAQAAAAPARSSGGSASADPVAAASSGENIVPTGLSDIDAVFSQVQGLLNLVRGARADIARADLALRTSLGIDAGGDLGDALKELKTEAKGAIKVETKGGKPRVTTKPGASPKVVKAVGGINQLVAALAGATQKLAQVPKQAQAIIAQAKTIPGTLPTTLKEAGMSPRELPGMMKKVKTNIKLTASIPKECAQVGKDAATTFKMVAASLA
mgnify:CR=1 FL=1